VACTAGNVCSSVTHQPHRDAGEREPWQRMARACAWVSMAQ
jgi:hypothetical protein